MIAAPSSPVPLRFTGGYQPTPLARLNLRAATVATICTVLSARGRLANGLTTEAREKELSRVVHNALLSKVVARTRRLSRHGHRLFPFPLSLRSRRRLVATSASWWKLLVRLHNPRMTRLTNAHTQTTQHHAAMMALWVANYYNFCRKHETLEKRAPAMAAERVWSLKALVEAVA